MPDPMLERLLQSLMALSARLRLGEKYIHAKAPTLSEVADEIDVIVEQTKQNTFNLFSRK